MSMSVSFSVHVMGWKEKQIIYTHSMRCLKGLFKDVDIIHLHGDVGRTGWQVEQANGRLKGE